jgi:lysozyme family protein
MAQCAEGTMTLNEVLKDILDREGWPTYTNYPADRGGPTKGGLTLEAVRAWRRRPVSKRELVRLTKREALDILKYNYVNTNGIHRVSGALQRQLIDSAVLSGPSVAVKDLQRGLGRLRQDGLIGPVTLGRIETHGPDRAAQLLTVERTIRLAKIVAKDPTQLMFLVGWVRRALFFLPGVN